MNTFKKTGGFTLVELIIVIAILAILSSVAVAGYSSYIKRANNSAVMSELTNISTAATLANAQAGGIEKITITEKTEGSTTVLEVKIEADDDMASDFKTLFEASVKGMTGTADLEEDTYTGTIALPSAWNSSWYGEQTSVIYQNNAWPKAQ